MDYEKYDVDGGWAWIVHMLKQHDIYFEKHSNEATKITLCKNIKTRSGENARIKKTGFIFTESLGDISCVKHNITSIRRELGKLENKLKGEKQ